MPSLKQERGKKAHKDGFKAEQFTVTFLTLKGYKILERNFKPPKGSGAGEIDIIALKSDVLVFIEVKYRKTKEIGRESVSKNVQHRRVKGAEYYLMLHPEHATKQMRFDAVILSPNSSPEQIENAWEA